MSAAAGIRTAGGTRGHTRLLTDSTWPCPSAMPQNRPLPNPIRTAAGRQPHLLPPSHPTSISRLATPHPSRPLAVACLATSADGAPQTASGKRLAKKTRLPDLPTDPRDADDGHSSSGSSGSSSSRRRRQERPAAPAAAPAAAEEDLEASGWLRDDDGDESEDGEVAVDEADEGAEADGEYDEDEEEDEGADDDYAASFLEPDDAPREVATGDTPWGEVVLKAARGVLAQPALQGLELYLFRALPASRKVDIRLDKMDDLYGSPTIDDIERFQRGLFAALDRDMGPEAAGDISFEVSSPGAERMVRVPDELNRFAGLPLKVEYRGPDGLDTASVLLMTELDTAAGRTSWRLANVRANATVKGRALSKRQLSQAVQIPLADIGRVRIHVDF